MQALTPFLRDKQSRHHLLVTSAGNRGTDALAVALDRQLRKLVGDGGALPGGYVVRLHAIKSERSIVLQYAIAKRQSILSQRQSAALATGLQLPATESAMSSAIQAHANTFTACRYAGVEDDRVEVIELSLGQRMLEVAGGRPKDTSVRTPNSRTSNSFSTDTAMANLSVEKIGAS